MSELLVPLTTVDDVLAHPNAERLDIVKILGWQVCVAKDSMKRGDLVVYVPPDAMVPADWADKWGVAPYLGKDGRVRAVRLRGEPSYGFAVPFRGETAEAMVGSGPDDAANCAHVFGITKYVPPPPKAQRPGPDGSHNSSMPEHPAFARYTDIENLRNYPTMLEGLEVVVTEKIHGTNSRVAAIDGVRMAGSHRVQRRSPEDEADRAYEFEMKRYDRQYDDWYDALPRWKQWAHDNLFWFSPPRMTEVVNSRNPGSSVYWKPWDEPGVAAMLDALGQVHAQVELFGELYGPSIQKLGYGVPEGEVKYVAFDLMLDGRYMHATDFEVLCAAFGVVTAPILYTGPFDLDTVKELSEGPTVLGDGVHFREGVVVKPNTEQRGPHGRLISKFVADTFLVDKHGASEDLSNDAAEAAEELTNVA